MMALPGKLECSNASLCSLGCRACGRHNLSTFACPHFVLSRLACWGTERVDHSSHSNLPHSTQGLRIDHMDPTFFAAHHVSAQPTKAAP